MNTPSPPRYFSSLLLSALAATVIVACGDTGDTGGNTTSGSTGEGLPCDVAQVLANRCWSCHGATPAGGAPMSLAGYAQMVAAAKSDPSKTNVEISIERMTANTMPPNGGATADEIAVLEAWVAAGSPQGTCENVTDPFGGAVVCTSEKTWTFGEDVSDPMRQQMHPGGACITCHDQQPPFEMPEPLHIGGTVYPTGHEPNECYGVDGSVSSDVHVQIEDSAGNVYDLQVNATGNFLLFAANAPTFAPPYKAKVVSSAGERAMTATQTSGDCNACHTESGGGAYSTAPGRIVAP